ncbi:MAG: Ferredoxin, 2Fe-2S [bacterium ADurb.Bin425]|nr:MAG: Ferredoxin, 2Fe-2S [bacterium ADurb.Bin425]
MAEKQEKPKIFVCTKGKKCPKKGGEDVCAAITAAAAQHDIAVKGSKCLDLCKKGPAVVVSPGKRRYGRVKVEDAQAIVDSALQGTEVVSLTVTGKKKDKK